MTINGKPKPKPKSEAENMKTAYINKITALLKRVRPKLSATHRLEFKNVFGAVGGYVDGKIFVSCGKFGVAFKLPPEILNELFHEKNIKHLQYFPNGHIKKEYAVLSRAVIEDKKRLKKLAGESVKCVLS